MVHVRSMQAGKPKPAPVKAHFPPSQKPGIKNSIGQSEQSSGGSASLGVAHPTLSLRMLTGC